MATWHEITRDPEYQSLSAEAKAVVKRGFFDRQIVADPEFQGFPKATQDAISNEFWNTPDDTGQGYVTSMMGAAGRGFGEILPGAIQGAGALTGISPLESAGKSIREGIEYISPVNPLYAESVPVKGAGVVGQIGSVLATAGVGGAVGKGLAAERIAAAAEPAIAASQAVGRGANAALYGSAALQGGASGAQTADQYGLTGANRYGNILAGAVGEMGSEMLGGTATETSAVRRLLSGGSAPRHLAKDIFTEGAEEYGNQVFQNAALGALAPAGTKTPDLTEGALEAGAYGAFGGGILGGINIATGAYKPAPIQAADTLIAAAEATSPDASLTAQAAKETVNDLSRYMPPAELQSGLYEAPQPDLSADAFSGLQTIPNEQPIDPATGIPVPQDGTGEVAIDEPAAIAAESNLGGGVLPEAQLEAPQQVAQEILASEAEATIGELLSLPTKASEVEAAKAAANMGGLIRSNPEDLTLVRSGNSKVFFNKRTGEYVKLAPFASPEKMADLQQQIEFLKANNGSRFATLPAMEVAHDSGIAILSQLPAGVEGLAVKKKAGDAFTKADQSLFDSLQQQNPLSSNSTKNPLIRVETDSALKNMGLVLGQDGRVRTTAFDFDGFSSEDLQSFGKEAASILATHPDMPGVPLTSFSPEVQKIILESQPLSPAATTQETPSSPAAKLEKEEVVPGTSAKMEDGGRSIPPVGTKETSQEETSSGKVEAAKGDVFARLARDAQRKPLSTQSERQRAINELTEDVKRQIGNDPTEIQRFNELLGLPKTNKSIPRIATAFLEQADALVGEQPATMQEAFGQDMSELQVGDVVSWEDKDGKAHTGAILSRKKNVYQIADKTQEATVRLPRHELTLVEDANKASRQAAIAETVNSVAGGETGLIWDAVSVNDGLEALARLHNSGRFPGLLNAFVGTAKEFAEREKNNPDPYYQSIIALINHGAPMVEIDGKKRPNVAEGYFFDSDGRTILFTDKTAIAPIDKRIAEFHNVPPAVAASMRVLMHEGLGHRGWWGLPEKDRATLTSMVKAIKSPEDFDRLAKLYPQYADWAKNADSESLLVQEFISKIVESLRVVPKDGPIRRLIEYLQEIWQKYFGKKEGTLSMKELRLFVEILQAGSKAPKVELVNGGGIKMSQLRAQGFVTPEMDKAYMDAVESGDMQTAQRMVDEAANNALARSKAREGGKLMLLQHETPVAFTVFKPGGDDPSRSGPAIWLGIAGSSLKAGHRLGNRKNPSLKSMGLFADIKNPLLLDDEGMVDWAREVFLDGKSDRLKKEFPLLITEDVVNRIKAEGYDGIIFDTKEDRAEMQRRIDEHVKQMTRLGNSTSTEMKPFDKAEIIVFSPEQLKSADPVTRDDAGNVIPLSQRFNPAKVDIRESRVENEAKTLLPSSDEYLKTNDIGGVGEAELLGQYRRYANDYLNWRAKGTGLFNLVSPIYVGDTGGRMAAASHPLQARIGENDRITIDIGNPIPSGVKIDEATAKKRIADAVDEEIIHAADLLALKAKWENNGSKGKLSEFILSETQKATDDILKSYSGMLAADKSAMDSAIEASFSMYFGKSMGVKLPDFIAALRNNGRSDIEITMLAELTRQVIQLRQTGGITETGWRSISKPLIEWMRKMVDALRIGAKKIRDGQFGKILQARVNDAEEQLRQLMSAPEIKASRISYANPLDAQLASAAERMRQMREKQGAQEVDAQSIRNEIRKAYDDAIKGQGSVQAPLQQVYDIAKAVIPTLTEKQFGEQVQALYEDGSAFLVPTDRSADMLAAGEKWGVYDVAGLPASYVGVMPSQETTKVYATGSIFQGGRGRVYSSMGKAAHGAGVASIPAGDNSERAQTLRRVVDEGVWANSTPMQRKEALDAFGEELYRRNSAALSSDALESVSTRRTIRPEENPSATINGESNREVLLVDFNTTIHPKHDILNQSALEAFAFMYDAMNEEMIHLAQHIATWREWIASGSKQWIDVFQHNKYVSMLNDVVNQRFDPVAKSKIDWALMTSWNMYHPNNPKSSIEEVFAELQGHRLEIPAYMMELGRQLVQIGRQDFTTETGWARFKETLIKWANEIRNALRSVLADVKGGTFGKLLKNEIDAIEGVISHLESGGGVMPQEVKASRVAGGRKKADISPEIREQVKLIGSNEELALNRHRALKALREAQPKFHIKQDDEPIVAVAINIVDALKASGAKPQELNNYLTDPEFLDDLGIPIDSSLYQALAMEIYNQQQEEVTRLENAGNMGAANKLRKYVSAMQKQWYESGTRGGQRLNIRKQLINNPRYQGLFLATHLNEAMRENAQEKAEAQTNIKAEDIEGADKKAKDEASEKAADEFADLEMEELDRLGEEQLDVEEKSLWRQIKDYIADLGAIALANIQAAASNIKASNAAMSAGDRVKKFLAMTQNERNSKEAEIHTKLKAAMKKFMGKGTEAQKRVKKDLVEGAEENAKKDRTKKTLKDKILNQDQEKAFAAMMRKLSSVRRANKTPFKASIPWKKLFSLSKATQAERRADMEAAIREDESLRDLSDEDQAKLADLIEAAWEAQRKNVFDREIDRLTRLKKTSAKAKAALIEGTPKLLEMINQGALDNDELYALIAEKFGFKPLSPEQKSEIEKIAQQLQDDLPPYKRSQLVSKFKDIITDVADVPFAQKAADWWVTAVLSSPRTAFTIGLGFLSGGYQVLSTAFSTVVRHSGDINAWKAAGAAINDWVSSMPRHAGNALGFLWDGREDRLDPTMSNISAWLNLDKKSLTQTSTAAALLKSKNPISRLAGGFMTFFQRLLTALDLFNAMATKDGSLALAYYQTRQSQNAPFSIQELSNLRNFKAARNQVLATEFNNVEPSSPAQKTLLNSWANQLMWQQIAKFEGVVENATFNAQQGAMSLDPSGVGGILYHAILGTQAKLKEGSTKFMQGAKKDWLDADSNTDKAIAFNKMALAYFYQFAAHNLMSAVGLRFIRYAGNRLNQTISFVPGLGLFRLHEKEGAPQEMLRSQILANQTFGTILGIWAVILLKEMADEPDEEKRGWGWEGGWDALTPERKSQRMSAGKQPYTLTLGGKTFKYQNWPGGGIMAAVGSLMDMAQYAPDKWNERTIPGKIGSALLASALSVTDSASLSQFSQMFGRSVQTRDPLDAATNTLSKFGAGYVGGFIPRIAKDVDAMFSPEIYRAKAPFEFMAREVPVYRRGQGSAILDIFAKPVAPSRSPSSREFIEQPTEPEYRQIGRLNEHGIWLTPASPDNRLVGKGARKRHMTDEEGLRYIKATGNAYREFVLRNTDRILSMPPERARQFVLDKADDIRDRAAKQAVRIQ